MNLREEIKKRRSDLKRAFYEEGVSKEEFLFIRDRIFFIEANIVYLYELPLITSYSIEVMSRKLYKMIEPLESFSLIVDVSETQKSDARIRDALEQAYCDVRAKSLVLYTGENILANAPVKFIAASITGDWDFQVVQCRKKAVEIAKRSVG